jgi:Uma2 family endonuclease
MNMILTKQKIGPRHHGRKMSLKRFEFMKVEDGFVAELARGYLVGAEVANSPHGLRIGLIRDYLGHYKIEHPGVIHATMGSQECKLLIPEWESERHPDLSIYLTRPDGPLDRYLWRTWIPELVIEVVSESSRDRDYTQKREEYWTLGVKEYWIVDAELQRILVLRHGRSQWTEKTLGPDDSCETKLLPGFKLPCKGVLDVAGSGEDD